MKLYKIRIKSTNKFYAGNGWGSGLEEKHGKLYETKGGAKRAVRYFAQRKQYKVSDLEIIEYELTKLGPIKDQVE